MVYEVILSKASPLFKTMFSLPQPATDTRPTVTPQDSRPIVFLAEHNKILATLLLAIYPPTRKLASVQAEPLSLSDHIGVLDMARKYDMEATSCRLLIDFQASEALENNHLEAFYAAYRRELREAADVAARASLKYPFTLEAIGDEMQNIDGPAFFTLWKFHRACSAVAVKVNSDHNYKWIPKAPLTWWSAISVQCRCRKIIFRLGSSLSRWSTHTSWATM